MTDPTPTPDRGNPEPLSRRAAWSGESATLVSGDVTLHLFRRTTGWGWGELAGPDAEPLAVLDALGEIALVDDAVPARLESTAPPRPVDGGLEFDLASADTAAALAGSSFGGWVGPPYRAPALTGRLVIRPDGAGGFDLAWELRSELDVRLRWFRGPWLRVGATSTGAERDAAILPGIEWALGREWTSGDDWFRDPWALRATPPVDSVAVPQMTVARGGSSVSLSWEPDAEATGWFSMAPVRAQPVFASPDFVERTDASLLGLMLPEAEDGAGWSGGAPLELHRGQRIRVAARISVRGGDAVDAVVAWVRERGLPDPEAGDAAEALHRIARTYAHGLWHPGEGFGPGQTPGDVRPMVPRFAASYLARFAGHPAAEELRARIAELGDGAVDPRAASSPEALTAAAEELLGHQHPDGGFRFDPAGRHRSKDDFVVARDLVAPMGLAGDEALDLDALPALTLLRAAEATGDGRFRDAGLRALDHAARFVRPDGGDYWETPLHAPNLLAAGHAAVASALAHRLAGRPADARATRRRLRSLLVFTHLWSPAGHPMTYNTKPCLCSSDWYFANWVRDHVQWEVLESFALAAELGLDLGAHDPDLDWARYHAGITWAGVRWLLDHRDGTWRPHNLPETAELYRAGRFDGCLPDTHNSTTGRYGGMAIPPDAVAVNLLALPA